MLQALSTLQDVQETYDWMARMRAEQPVWLDEKSGCWHVFRYEDVLRVSTDHAAFSSERRPRPFARLDKRANQAPSLLTMDPPRHRQYRNLVSPAFTSRALAPLTGRISAIVQELLDQVRPHGSMDIIADLAYPLPTTVIAEMLGLPITDRPRFKLWADALFSRQLSDEEMFNSDEDLEQRPGFQRANRAMEEMNAYFEQMLAERRRAPRDDMMSELLAAEVEGTRLSQGEILSFCTLLLLAGHVTTTNLLGQAMRCLDSHPAAMRQLRAQPELTTSAVEEVLRYASPVWRLSRVARAEVELAGVTIPEDAIIFAWLASANRDEAQFPDPEHFDITRSPNRHVAFGHGIHFCVGAPLARMEAAIALPMMLEQLPDLRVASDKPLELLGSRFLFGVKKLPMTFAASSVTNSSHLSHA
jgi:cytochrome P450